MSKLRRRNLLRGLGVGLVAAPFVDLLLRPRRAAAAGVARRLVVFFSPNGTVPARWTPEGGPGSLSFPTGSILEPLAPVAEHLTVVAGLDFFGADNHEGGMAAMLTNQGSLADVSAGMSVDQYIAKELKADTRFTSLELGVQTSAWGGSTQTRMSYAGPGAFVTPDDNPAQVYTRLFGDFVGGDAEAMKLMARRQRVVDLLVDEARDLRGQLGAEERPKLDAHLEALAQVEKGLSGVVGCAVPDAPAAVNALDNGAFPEVGAAQLDLLTLALACDMTRVASIQFSHTVSPTVLSWLGQSEGHHSLSHIDDSNVAGVDQFVAAERWFAEQFRGLIERLAMIPEPDGDGTLLDNTLVVWAKEMGDSRAHVCTGVPFVLAGGAGGYLPSGGRLLQFPGVSHGRLLVSICQAMGLSNDTFGNATYGAGPLEGLRA
ncbi:MAG: DUF1552 domain-containing protein [Nannocystis sp.]|nr:DUF1552 domain-containing protein [Nannocystis sp.]